MKKWVQDFLELQALDLRIKKMKIRQLEIPKEKKESEKQLHVELEKVEVLKTELKEAEVAKNGSELKIESFKEKIKTLEAKSSQIKNNDEYRALLTEIETCKYHIKEEEAKLAEKIEAIDTVKASLKTAEQAYQSSVNDLAETKEELEELEEGLETEVNKCMDVRKKQVAKVDQSVYPLYARLIRREGQPLCAIKNNTCGNCHLRLTPQTINDSKKGMITTCDFCGHIVYYNE